MIVPKSEVDEVLVGTGEIPDIDSSFSSFSATVAFSTVRMMVALTVEHYHLSGAF